MNQQDKELLIEKWLEGKTTDDELLKSIPSEELSQYKTILNTVDNWVPLGGEEAPNRLQEITRLPKEARVVSFNRTAWIVSIAASIALLAVVSFLFFGSSETTYYAENDNLEILLPDQSTKVILSKGASLRYDDFDTNQREVEITGRVYFDVTEKGPFQVNYEEGSIAVLGTQFEIVHYADFFEASCFEGSVKVNYRGEEALMEEGEQVLFVEGTLPKIKIHQEKPGWTKGTERFDDDALAKVIKVIEIRYGVSINAEDITIKRRFTGTMPTNNLELACKAVFAPLGINYQIQNKEIILSE